MENRLKSAKNVILIYLLKKRNFRKIRKISFSGVRFSPIFLCQNIQSKLSLILVFEIKMKFHKQKKNEKITLKKIYQQKISFRIKNNFD